MVFGVCLYILTRAGRAWFFVSSRIPPEGNVKPPVCFQRGCCILGSQFIFFLSFFFCVIVCFVVCECVCVFWGICFFAPRVILFVCLRLCIFLNICLVLVWTGNVFVFDIDFLKIFIWEFYLWSLCLIHWLLCVNFVFFYFQVRSRNLLCGW